MTVQKYSTNEALNRLYRLLRGDAAFNDTPGSVPGEIYSDNEALSRLAELLADSLPGETFTIPATASVLAGSLPVGVVPSEYSGIYTATGTVTVVMGTSWAQITGTFHADMDASANVTPNAAEALVALPTGYFLIFFQVSFSGTANATFTIAPYLGSTRLNEVTAVRKLGAGGDVGSCSAFGIVDVDGAGNLNLRAKADGSSKNFFIQAGQLMAYKIADT